MVKKTAIFALSLFMALVIACAPSRLEMDYGTSLRLATEQQILNPEAGHNLESVQGLDGVSAANALEKRRSEFKKETPAPTSVIMGEIMK